MQTQLDALETRIDPELVTQLLTLRRDVMFLEFDVAVRHALRETFLATGNVAAHKVTSLVSASRFGALSNQAAQRRIEPF